MENELLFSMTDIEKSFGPVQVLKKQTLRFEKEKFTLLWARMVPENLL